MKIITEQTACNTYIVFDEQTLDAVIIDPGSMPELILHDIEKLRLKPAYILLTHAHFDHIGAIDAVAEKTGAKLLMSENDAPMLKNDIINLAIPLCGEQLTVSSIPEFVSDGGSVKAGSLEFSVISVPGHSEGCVCYISGKSVFCGDLLFNGSIGRTDFYTSDVGKMKESLSRIMTLQDDYTVYPGHGEKTTIGDERRSNPFLRMFGISDGEEII